MSTPADNPHKPGTHEHREWEHVNVHEPRICPGPELTAAYKRANGRLAALKAHLTPQAERSQWVADICAEVAAATRECGPDRKPPATGGVITAPLGLTSAQFKAIRDRWKDNSIDLVDVPPAQGDVRYDPDTGVLQVWT